eukprot:UN04395
MQKSLKNLTYSEFIKCVPTIYNDIKSCDILVHGNVSQKHSESFMKELTDGLNITNHKDNYFPPPQCNDFRIKNTPIHYI